MRKIDTVANSTLLTGYERLLASWPGLVSDRDRRDVHRLVEDSLVLLDHLGRARRIVDVGAGGGMPGIPLKIARPELEVTLVEADRKKAAFCVHAAAVLGLELDVVAERAEVVGRGDRRERFDAAVSRALAALPVVAELCLPLVRVGGVMLAMKTADSVEEGAAAARRLGGGTPAVLPAPSSARGQGIVVRIEKVVPTPEEFPRRPGLPSRRPLG